MSNINHFRDATKMIGLSKGAKRGTEEMIILLT